MPINGHSSSPNALRKARRTGWGPLWVFLLAGLLVLLLARAAAADIARNKVLAEGQEDYAENCVACHGADGTGTGDLGQVLVRPPKDLTTIAQRNGGTFPFWQIFDIIAGEKEMPGHETFQMPQYFGRMRGQDFAPGYLPAHVRILELTHYLESIQKE